MTDNPVSSGINRSILLRAASRMKLKQFQIDAFASEVFAGNPAAVVPLQEWLPDAVLQSIAMENQLSETAFFVPDGTGFHLRWFTPVTEVNLCGHATLASAHTLFHELSHSGESIRFSSRSGQLEVVRNDVGYRMDFPADPPSPAPDLRTAVEEALGIAVLEVLRGREDLVAILVDQKSVAELQPDMRSISEVDTRGILATAPGNDCDFVSRCFFPRFGIDEDPVTGSAQTTLAPFWSERLSKEKLSARQISARGGEIGCEIVGDRVHLSGKAVTFMRGEIEVPD